MRTLSREGRDKAPAPNGKDWMRNTDTIFSADKAGKEDINISGECFRRELARYQAAIENDKRMMAAWSHKA